MRLKRRKNDLRRLKRRAHELKVVRTERGEGGAPGGTGATATGGRRRVGLTRRRERRRVRARVVAAVDGVRRSGRSAPGECDGPARVSGGGELLRSFRNGAEMVKSFSLEDLLVFVKKADTTAAETELKRERRRSSASSSSHSYEIQCHDTKSLLPEEMVRHLRNIIGTRGQVVHIEEISARNAKYVEIPRQLSENVKSALNRVGITRLYSHQAESIQASLLALAQDQLRALTTITHGLDDSLNIGIYDGDTSQEDRLWLRDNARLLITNPDMLHVSILPFHGQFRRILSNLRFIVIDEAHSYKGTFGCHAALIFRRLRRICSHVYSSDPSFVFSTATSANPKEHAMELANLPTVELIENDGSPSGLKLFMLWNPPLCLKTVPKRRKSSLEPEKSVNKNVVAGRSRLNVHLRLMHSLAIVLNFSGTYERRYWLFYNYLQFDRRRIESDFFNGNICGIAATNALELGIDVGHIDVTLHLGFPGSIASLWQQAGRSGRREKPSLAIYVAFEGPLDQYFMKFPHKLFRGPIECCHVDPTNDQVLQQHLSCAALEHPLSVLHDEKYFGAGLEKAIMRLKDKGCLSTDLSRDCAARIWAYIGHEVIHVGKYPGFMSLFWSNLTLIFPFQKSPSNTVHIRAIETERYKVIDQIKNEVLEEIEESKAFFQVYEGAVYMNQGKTYLVKHLDISSKIAWCQQADVKFMKELDGTLKLAFLIHLLENFPFAADTIRSSSFQNDLHELRLSSISYMLDFVFCCLSNLDLHCSNSGRHSTEAYPARIINDQFARTTAQTNMCKVTTTWFGFRRIWRRSNEVFDTVELSLPEYSYESQAVWIRVPQSVKTAVETSYYSFRGGLHAAGHALLNVIPLFIICNQSDLASECANPHDNRYVPERILLYDPHPGGTGISAKVQPVFMELLTAALELLSSCHCSGEAGCPNCVQNLACHEYNEVLHKDAALMIIKGVLDAEQSNLKKNLDSPSA
ncbi:hypothetical protein DH2020_019548 [Rehmannia glutinosa]|uniref:Uncharacterized protein n=1 Tax=Rehmannia glutinosa TaxID=99300 RepID=A0ABR0WPT9_REHGL